MHTSRKILAVPVLVAAAALSLVGCSGIGAQASTAHGKPIYVAATTSLAVEPETTKAAQAVFDDFNAKGGLDGRPIKLTTYDDKSDPTTSATAAKKIVSSNAVAVVGGGSQLDCAVNGKTWDENKIIDIPGIATDPYCFTNPNIAPPNSGALYGTFAALYNASENHGLTHICGELVYDSAVAKVVFQQAFDAWTAATGHKLTYIDGSLTRGQASYAANVSALKQHNCDAVFLDDYSDGVVNFLGEATNQGIKLPVIALTPVYSDQFAQSAASYGGPIYVSSEFVPYNSTSGTAISDWKKVMKQRGVPQTAFAEGGYLSANYFIDLLKSMKGDITRATVTAAAQSMSKPASSPLTEGTWIFGSAATHQPNTKAWPAVLKPGSGVWTSDGKPLDGTKIGWIPTKLTD